jgi:hypothetical protein
VRVEVELTRDDYYEAGFAAGESARDAWKPLRVGGVAAMTAAVFLLLAPCGVPKAASAALLLVGLLLVSFAVIGPDRALHRGWLAYSEALGRATWEFTEDAATLITSAGDSQHPWDYFERFVEHGNIFLLYHGDGVYIIPKRALGSPDVVREFRRLLQEKVHPPLRAFPVIPANRP